MRIQRIYDKLAKYSRIAEEKKSKTTLSKCKYDFSKKRVNPKLSMGDVKLSLMDEIKRTYEWLQEISSIASYYAYDRFDELTDKFYDFRNEASLEVDNLTVNSGVSGLEENGQVLQEELAEVEKVAEMLGVPPNEIYENYDEAKELADNSSELWTDVKREWFKYYEVTNQGVVGDFW